MLLQSIYRSEGKPITIEVDGYQIQNVCLNCKSSENIAEILGAKKRIACQYKRVFVHTTGHCPNWRYKY